MHIHLFPNDQINKNTWDDHIRQCKNSLIYGYSFFLDHMCPGWYALIDDTENFFMPLPVQKKWGIPYSYQPGFTQQLGIFFKTEISDQIISDFLARIENISRDINLHLNYANCNPHVTERCNLIIDMDHSFEKIRSQFRKDLIIKPMSLKLIYGRSYIHEVFDSYEKYVLPGNRNITRFHFQSFKKLTFYLEKNGQAFTRKITSPDGETLSTALFFSDQKRIYYMMASNSPEGRKTNANALLLFEAIREFSGQKKVFDFEGSEISGVRFFFEKFSPKYQPYYHYKKNNLNLFIRMMICTARNIRSFWK